jgi:oxalate decarboxylase
MMMDTKEQEPNELNETSTHAGHEGVSRRAFMGVAVMAGANLATASALAQTRAELLGGRTGDNASDPGPENTVLLRANPNSNLPPFTDHGNPHPIWYSFDLTPKRIESGGWTHQVTSREIPRSQDLAGVNMRLTAGSFRELHWHLADEWAIMLAGKARITVMQPDGLVFDQGDFSEDDTFLLSEFLAHTPPEVVEKNTGWKRQEWDQLPPTELYIFEAPLPGPLAADKQFLGEYLKTEKQYTFKMGSMIPTSESPNGDVRIVDSSNFTVAKNIAAAMVTIKPGGIREMHWHPNTSEWQYWIKGQGRMTVVFTEGRARTMDFRANDVGFVPSMAGHYIENTGTEDLVFLEMFKASRYQDVSLNQWIARMPDKMAVAHLKLPVSTIRRAPQDKTPILPR